MFEILIAILVCSRVVPEHGRTLTFRQVLAVLVCMAIIISKIQVDWGMAFDGFVPSKYVFAPGALYTCKVLCSSYLRNSFHVHLQLSAFLVPLSCLTAYFSAQLSLRKTEFRQLPNQNTRYHLVKARRVRRRRLCFKLLPPDSSVSFTQLETFSLLPSGLLHPVLIPHVHNATMTGKTMLLTSSGHTSITAWSIWWLVFWALPS